MNNDTLRLWAYQWVTRGEVPDLPKDAKLLVANERTKIMSVHFGPPGVVSEHEVVDLREFVVEGDDTIWTCRVGYGERTKTLVVTPVVAHLRYNLVEE